MSHTVRMRHLLDEALEYVAEQSRDEEPEPIHQIEVGRNKLRVIWGTYAKHESPWFARR